MLPYLRKGGSVIVNSNPIMPVTAVLKGSSYNGGEMIAYLKAHVDNLTVVDCNKACGEIGTPKVLNTVLLGAAVRTGELGLDIDDIKGAIAARVKPQFHKMNFTALDYSENQKG